MRNPSTVSAARGIAGLLAVWLGAQLVTAEEPQGPRGATTPPVTLAADTLLSIPVAVHGPLSTGDLLVFAEEWPQREGQMRMVVVNRTKSSLAGVTLRLRRRGQVVVPETSPLLMPGNTAVIVTIPHDVAAAPAGRDDALHSVPPAVAAIATSQPIVSGPFIDEAEVLHCMVK